MKEGLDSPPSVLLIWVKLDLKRSLPISPIGRTISEVVLTEARSLLVGACAESSSAFLSNQQVGNRMSGTHQSQVTPVGYLCRVVLCGWSFIGPVYALRWYRRVRFPPSVLLLAESSFF